MSVHAYVHMPLCAKVLSVCLFAGMFICLQSAAGSSIDLHKCPGVDAQDWYYHPHLHSLFLNDDIADVVYVEDSGISAISLID